MKGLITVKDIEKAVMYPNTARDKKSRLLCGAAIGVTKNVLERARALAEVEADVFCMDSAHGHSKNIMDCVYKVKNRPSPTSRLLPATSPPPTRPAT